MGGKGSGGHNRKPSALRKLQGNAGHRKLNEKEPVPLPGEPTLPKGTLTAEAQAWWRKLVPILQGMKVLTSADGVALAGLCMAITRRMQAEKLIERYGPIVAEKTITGEGDERRETTRLKINPAVRIASDADRRMRSYLASFGLEPSARARLAVEGQIVGHPQDPLEDLISGGDAGEVVQ